MRLMNESECVEEGRRKGGKVRGDKRFMYIGVVWSALLCMQEQARG